MSKTSPPTNYLASQTHDSLVKTADLLGLLTQLLLSPVAASTGSVSAPLTIITEDLRHIGERAIAASNTASARAAPPTLHRELFAPTALSCARFCRDFSPAGGLTVGILSAQLNTLAAFLISTAHSFASAQAEAKTDDLRLEIHLVVSATLNCAADVRVLVDLLIYRVTVAATQPPSQLRLAPRHSSPSAV